MDDEREIFDRIVLTVDSVRTELTVAEFNALPLLDRVRHLMEGELEFFMGKEVVNTRLALSSIRHKATTG